MQCYGYLKHTNKPFCRKYNWQITQASALGITFTNGTIEVEKVNFTDKILEFEACLEKWKKWNLSLLAWQNHCDKNVCVPETFVSTDRFGNTI